jgi:hypothetical protein
VIRFFLIVGVLFLGMIIGGDAHLVASIISHVVHAIFHFPLLAVGLLAGTVIGLWLGGDYALRRLGTFERHRRHTQISEASDEWNPFK